MDKKTLAERYLIHRNQIAPKEALRSLQYSAELQEKRLEKYGLKHNSSFRYRGLLKGNQVREWEDEYYKEELYVHTAELTDTFYNGEKRIFHREKPVVCYTTVVDLKGAGTHGREEDVYCCPHCGAAEKIKTLLEKCPYCDTHFEISELYPKVENSYSVLDISGTNEEINKEVKKHVIPFMLLGIIINAAVNMRSGFSVELIFPLVTAAIAGAAIGYVIWGIRKIGRVFIEAGRSVPMLSGAGSAKKYEKVLSRYSGAYTYEHFTGVVVSLLKILIYSDSDTALPFYSGKDNTLFSDVIDCGFRGAMTLKSLEVRDFVCAAKVKVFMENLHYDGKIIKEKRDAVLLTVKKDLRGDTIKPFSVHAISCRSCGGSFDAYKNRKCPYCGREYELRDLDWVITDISQG